MIPAGGATDGHVRVFTIPAGAGEPPVVVGANELPDDANEIGEVLLAVKADATLWLDIIAEYGRQRKFSAMEALIAFFYRQGESLAGAVSSG
jgi:hypothetical protein